MGVKANARACGPGGTQLCQLSINFLAGVGSVGIGVLNTQGCDTLAADVQQQCQTVGGSLNCIDRDNSAQYTFRETFSTRAAAPACPASRFDRPPRCYTTSYG